MSCPICTHTNRPAARFCAQCGAPLLLQNKYRITQLLGRGGFGAVYLAENQTLGGALCAVKELTLDSQLTPQERQQAEKQFRFEASLLAKLNHLALPKVWDYFDEQNRYFLVMEYVEGETLAEQLKRTNAPLPENQVRAWANNLLDALDYLHTQNPPIIHRDIKPANIKLTARGIKLIDFGIAKLMVTGSGTTSGARAYSPPYSPLEQYGSGTDARSDLYALGVTLYELLTGNLPPAAPDRVRIQAIPPTRFNPALSNAMESVILRAMAVNSADRFQSAREMRNALANPVVTTTQPAQANPYQPTPTAVVPNAPTRNAIVFAIIGAFVSLIALVCLIFVGGQVFTAMAIPKAATPTRIVAPTSAPILVPSSVVPLATIAPAPTQAPTRVPPTLALPSPTFVLPNDTVSVVEDFSSYGSIGAFRSVYTTNAAWDRNDASLSFDNVNGAMTLRLDYNIRGTDGSNNYIVLDRCIYATQDWRGAQAIELWVQNDNKPKELIVQFGEGVYCTPGSFPIEVWHAFVPLSANQSGVVRVRWDNFTQEKSWAASLNNRIDLNSVGYFSIGIRGNSLGSDTFQFGLIRAVR